MMRNETDLLDFVGSLGAVLTTIAAVVFFGQKASDVGKVTLCFLGAVILIISLPGIASVRMLISKRRRSQDRPRARLQLEGWRAHVEIYRRNPLDPRVRDELQRAAA
jgi:hypothetical protein